jgi:hypothetical protein
MNRYAVGKWGMVAFHGLAAAVLLVTVSGTSTADIGRVLLATAQVPLAYVAGSHALEVGLS